MFYGPGDVRWEHRPDLEIESSTDAVVRVVAACVCGSDLWGFRGFRPGGDPRPIGHELVGDGDDPAGGRIASSASRSAARS